MVKCLPDWYLTNKYPLFNDRKDVIGLMGTVRPYGDGDNKELKWERDDEIGRAVNHIRNHFRGEISISDLVDISGLSHRKLHRGFVELLGLHPCSLLQGLELKPLVMIYFRLQINFLLSPKKMGFTIKVPSPNFFADK